LSAEGVKCADWLREATVPDIRMATHFLKRMVKALADQLDSEEGDAFIELTIAKIGDGSLQALFESPNSGSQGSQDDGSTVGLLQEEGATNRQRRRSLTSSNKS
jgi:hypothetical protein